MIPSTLNSGSWLGQLRLHDCMAEDAAACTRQWDAIAQSVEERGEDMPDCSVSELDRNILVFARSCWIGWASSLWHRTCTIVTASYWMVAMTNASYLE